MKNSPFFIEREAGVFQLLGSVISKSPNDRIFTFDDRIEVCFDVDRAHPEFFGPPHQGHHIGRAENGF